MSVHGLTLGAVEADGARRSIAISVDAPTRGVAIVDVSVDSQSSPTPLHWRAGDGRKPPLDVALGPDGQIESVQVVFQDERVSMIGADVGSAEVGIPCFEVKGWPGDRYLDVRVDVHAGRLSSGELLLSLDGDPPALFLEVGDGLHVGLDAGDHLASIVIGPLDDEQWRLIDAISRQT